MEPIRKFDVEPKPEAPEAPSEETTKRILDEISRDARALKARYSVDTIVPEGGE